MSQQKPASPQKQQSQKTDSLIAAITVKEIQDYAAKADNIKLIEEHMVTQIWEDGEVTYQKGQDLLWSRSLHSIKRGFEGFTIEMPHRHGEHSFAFVTDRDAEKIRDMMAQMVGPVKKIREYVEQANNPKLIEEHDVFQIWEDGEITMQKAQDLLWRRKLNLMRRGLDVFTVKMPHEFEKHSFAFVTSADADRIREMMNALMV